MKEKILFEIIVSNQCNKRCSYCDLDFRNTFISQEVLDNFVNFIDKNLWEVEYFVVNFFWWEPLLWFEKIQYLVEKLKNTEKIFYSIWTNWLLLDKKKLDYLLNKNFKMYLSIDNETWNIVLWKDIFEDKTNIFINFIIHPKTIKDSQILFGKVIQAWFKNINIMPVFGTIKWGKEELILLQNLVLQIKNTYKDTKSSDVFVIEFFSYYNWVSSDKQFVLETNGNIYEDLDSLLWIQKQNKNIWEKLSNFIKRQTFIGNIFDIFHLQRLLNSYSIKNIFNMVMMIPKKQWLEKQYKIIDLIKKSFYEK